MQSERLKILFVENDGRFARTVTDILRSSEKAIEVTNVPTIDAGYAKLADGSFNVILLELPTANATALFQLTSLTTKESRLPVIVFGPMEYDDFVSEVVNSG